MKDEPVHEKPVIRMVFVGGDGLKTAFRLLARIFLLEMKGDE
jgi:hypothetical protein